MESAKGKALDVIVQRLVKDTGITEKQALGLNWPSLVREAKLLRTEKL